MNDYEQQIKDAHFYVVINNDGQFFRRKGYGGSGKSWVDDITTARIYIKIGHARAIVTYFAKEHPRYPVPRIAKLGLSTIEMLDQTAHVEKAKADEKKRIAVQQLRYQEHALERAERDLEVAKKRLAALKGGTDA